jgi:hypothetical protein
VSNAALVLMWMRLAGLRRNSWIEMCVRVCPMLFALDRYVMMLAAGWIVSRWIVSAVWLF